MIIDENKVENSITKKYIFQPDDPLKYQNWERNRPPDLNRVDEIVTDIQNSKMTLIPGVIYAWKNQNAEIWNIYDGIHRITAIERVVQQTRRPLACLIKFRICSNSQEIIQEFNNLNKSVPVPLIYFEEGDTQLKKTICMNLSTRFSLEYHPFQKTSRRPHKPHFNRDKLMEDLSELNIDFTRPNTERQLYLILMELNQTFAKRVSEEQSNKYLSKCRQYNLYLFNVDWIELKKRIERIINQ